MISQEVPWLGFNGVQTTARFGEFFCQVEVCWDFFVWGTASVFPFINDNDVFYLVVQNLGIKR